MQCLGAIVAAWLLIANFAAADDLRAEVQVRGAVAAYQQLGSKDQIDWLRALLQDRLETAAKITQSNEEVLRLVVADAEVLRRVGRGQQLSLAGVTKLLEITDGQEKAAIERLLREYRRQAGRDAETPGGPPAGRLLAWQRVQNGWNRAGQPIDQQPLLMQWLLTATEITGEGRIIRLPDVPKFRTDSLPLAHSWRQSRMATTASDLNHDDMQPMVGPVARSASVLPNVAPRSTLGVRQTVRRAPAPARPARHPDVFDEPAPSSQELAAQLAKQQPNWAAHWPIAAEPLSEKLLKQLAAESARFHPAAQPTAPEAISTRSDRLAATSAPLQTAPPRISGPVRHTELPSPIKRRTFSDEVPRPTALLTTSSLAKIPSAVRLGAAAKPIADGPLQNRIAQERGRPAITTSLSQPQPARVDVDELSARIAGYNSTLSGVVGQLQEPRAWPVERLEPVVEELTELLGRRSDLELYRKLVPPDERIALAELAAPDAVISLLATKIAAARQELAANSGNSAAERQARLRLLEALSQRLAELGSSQWNRPGLRSND